MRSGSPPPGAPILAELHTHIICSLLRNQVPEWAAAYVDYKGLKKLVKAAAETERRGEKVDLAGGISLRRSTREGRARQLTKPPRQSSSTP